MNLVKFWQGTVTQAKEPFELFLSLLQHFETFRFWEPSLMLEVELAFALILCDCNFD